MPVRQNATRDCLEGGGEMGALMRSIDWSTTPIGAVETWSPALRTMVRMLLVNRFQLFIWWGPRYVQIYNDASWPILGAKHPRSMGQPAAECWSEIWHVIGPLIDAPFHGGPATWMEDIFLEINRYGAPEETHFTIAYSPVPDETVPSGIGGVLATVHEITGKVVGERRVVVLRDLGAHAAEAKTAEEACTVAAKTLGAHDKDVPFALIYLLDADGRRAAIAAASGVAEGETISPRVVSLDGEDGIGWPLTEVLEAEAPRVVTDLADRFGAVPPGPWSDHPTTALVLPIPSTRAHQPAGLLVAGVSARLGLDEQYRGFLELVAGQIGTAVANARAYEEEKKRAEALAELDRAKTAFFSNVSHEFRTPLTLMLGPIEDALADPAEPLPPGQRERLETAHRSSVRLLKLVNTLLDFARIEFGRVQAVYEPIDLAALTTELASNFRSACEKAGLRLIVDCPPVPESVYVDRDMWEKVVLNLLSNAFKFTFEGEIRVGLRSVGGAVELTVRDTGTGIPAEEIPRVFERFHRVEGSRGRTHEGTGIGLALVQELAKLHGGSVRAESTHGQGSTFTVSVPLGMAHLPAERIGATRTLGSTAVRAGAYVEEALRWLPDEGAAPPFPGEAAWHRDGQPERSAAPQPSHVPKQDSQTAGRPRILWADDNADMREYVSRLLRELYDVEAFPDGEAALAAARARPPDLVLSDVMMPRLDGFGLLIALRADPRTRTIPVILLSARAGEESRVEGLEAGADDYLIKPFSARELLARVGAHLEMNRLREEVAQRERALLAETQAANQRLEAVLGSISDGFIALDRDWRYAAVNDRACESMGVSRDEVMGRRIWDLFPDTIGTRFETELRRAVTEHKPLLFEYFYPTRNRWYENRLYPSADGLSIFFAEITERKQAEERLAADLAGMARLQELSTRLVREGDSGDLLPEIVDAAIAITGADMGNIQLLDRGSGTLRIEASRGFEAPFLSFFHAVHAGEGTCGTAMQRGERVVVGEVATSPLFAGKPALDVMLAAGVRAVQSTPLLSRTGRLVGMLSTHYRTHRIPGDRDLTLLDALARQAADWIERTHAEEALRVSEGLFRGTFENAAVGIANGNRHGRLGTVNDTFCEIVGYSRDELRDKTFEQITHPEDLPANLELYARLWRGEIPSFSVEKRYVRRDGSVVWCAVTVSLQGDVIGAPPQAIAIVEDISERKQLEAALRQAKEMAEAANRSKDEFLANVSHEIRTPFGAILGMTEIVLDTPLTDDQRQCLETARSAADSLLGLVNELLDFAKIEAGKLELVQADFSLRSTIADILRALSGRARDQGLELAWDVGAEVPDALIGDAGRLRQVLLNLVGNAIKFTKRGEVMIRVETVDGPTSGGEAVLRFVVRDTGIGISPDGRERIFRAFEQADNSTTREYGGTGLGLTISARLVDQMGGKITVESEPGHGSTFAFTARFGRQQHPAEHVVAPPSDVLTEAAAPARAVAPLSILVAEDNEFNTRHLERLLGKHGHRVRVANHGGEALAELGIEGNVPGGQGRRALQFDLLLLDLHMPELDGFQVVRAVREWERAAGGHLPVIALTARARKEDRDRCLATGMDDYVSKPVRAGELFAAIDRVISAHGVSRAVPLDPEDRTNLLEPVVLIGVCGGDEEGLRELCEDFRAFAPARMTEVHDALRAGDAPRLREAAHRLRGLLSAFSTAAGDVAWDLEELAARGQLGEARPLVERLETMARELMRQLDGLSIESLRRRAGTTRS